MPLALDPEQTIELILKTDELKPESERPAFIAHYLTARQRRKIGEKIDTAIKAQTDEEAEGLIWDALKIGLVGWRNIKNRAGQPMLYDTETLQDVLTDTEAWELAGLLLRKTRIAENDLKNSALPSDTDSAASVNPVPELGNVQTNPA